MKHHLYKFLTAGLLLIFTTLCSFGQNNLEEKLPVDPNIKTGKLPNGLTYYIRQNNIPAKKAQLRLVVNAGSILEDDDQLGLAHFTEHMAFNGLKHFKKNELISFLQSIGVRFGDLNANTGYDETVYILPIPTDRKENFETAFRILEDWASGIMFDPREIDNERGVVLEEMRSGKMFHGGFEEVTGAKRDEGSRYAVRAPIGTEESIKTFKHKALKRFYKDWYRPNLMAVIAVGDLDVAETETLIKKHFAHLKNPTKPRPRAVPEIPQLKKTEGLAVADSNAPMPHLSILYSPSRKDPQTTVTEYRNGLVEHLISTMLEERLRKIEQKKVSAFRFPHSSMTGSHRGWKRYSMSAAPGDAGIEPAIVVLIQESERARKFGFMESELERAKKDMTKSVSTETDQKDSGVLASVYVNNFLEGEQPLGSENEYTLYSKLLNGITLEDVNRLAAKTIPAISDHKLIIYTGPEKSNFRIPTGEELVAMVDKAAKSELAPYKEAAAEQPIVALMEKAPAPGVITDERINTKLGITELTFANGVNVTFKPTDFKKNEVIMEAFRFGGKSNYARDESINAITVPVMVMGAGDFSGTELTKFSSDQSVRIHTQLDMISDIITGNCSEKTLEVMLQLLHIYCTQPRRDTAAFNAYIARSRSSFAMRSENPDFIHSRAIHQCLYNKHPWAPGGSNGEFDRYNIDRVLKIYREHFGNANGFTFVFVGKFDVEKIKPLLATYLGSLPSGERPPSFKDVGLRPLTGPFKKEFKKGSGEYTIVNVKWNGETTGSSEEQPGLQALMQILKIKFLETLREKMGGVYDVSITGSLTKYPYENFSIDMVFTCGPENVDALTQAAFDEINKIRTNGPLESDLNKVKETWKQQYRVKIKDNKFWLEHLIKNAEAGSDPAGILEYEKAVDDLKAKDVQRVANKYLDLKKNVQFITKPVDSD